MMEILEKAFTSKTDQNSKRAARAHPHMALQEADQTLEVFKHLLDFDNETLLKALTFSDWLKETGQWVDNNETRTLIQVVNSTFESRNQHIQSLFDQMDWIIELETLIEKNRKC